MVYSRTPEWPEHIPGNTESWSVASSQYDSQGRIIIPHKDHQVEPESNPYQIDLDATTDTADTLRYLAPKAPTHSQSWSYVPHEQRQFDTGPFTQPTLVTRPSEARQVPSWMDTALWREATTRYIRGDIGNLRGLGLLAMKSGALWRLLKTRGLVAAAAATVIPTALTPIPGDEILTGGTIMIMGASGVVGVIKKRVQLQKELTGRTGITHR